MGTTLQNGVYLPNEGERNCYAGLKTNWEILDQKVADVTALQQAVAGALHREIVASLPTTDIDPNTIYMILSGTSATENVYDEFMYVNNAWELIGTSATDLTNYYTKGDVDGLLLLKANASDLTSHTGDTTIHVTANDKTKWTNSANTHVLRLALSALTPSTSDNSFSNLDDSTALKVGDKVMDTAGVLFEVTAIDTANSTFTIGTALIDLAQDSDVVHKSGNETIAGQKTFDSNTYIYNSDNTATTPNLILKNSKSSKGSTSEVGAQLLKFVDKNNSSVGELESIVTNLGASELRFRSNTLDSNNQNVQTGVTLITNTNGGKRFCPTSNGDVSCGYGSLKWLGVYATNYYYGSNNVEFSNKFVTTDTAQTVTGTKTFSSNVNVYNSDNTADTPNLILKNEKQDRTTPPSSYGAQYLYFTDKNNSTLSFVNCGVTSSNVTQLVFRCYDKNGGNEGFSIRKSTSGTYIQPSTNNAVNLGTNNARWADVQTTKINALEPSSLSLPSQNYVDISSYFTNTGNGEYNTYTAPSNGWIFLRLGTISGCQAEVLDSSDNRLWGTSSSGSLELITIPILSGCKLQTQWITGSAVTVATAKFIPCQGNV